MPPASTVKNSQLTDFYHYFNNIATCTVLVLVVGLIVVVLLLVLVVVLKKLSFSHYIYLQLT